MRKIGTISASIGLIFLGIWMLIYRENAGLGDIVIRFWPVLIILLGIEVLLFSRKREDGSRPSFNFLIIPILIVFLFINIFQGIGTEISKGFHFNNSFNFSGIFDDARYKLTKSTKVLPSYGSDFTFQANNEDIVINKSSDKNITIEADVYTDRSNPASYNINEDKGENGYSININEDYVKKVKVTLTIPDGLNLNIKGDNVNINSSDDMAETKLILTGNNGNVNLSKMASIKADFDNGSFDLNDIISIDVKSNNGKADVKGNAENINLAFDNGKINVNNNLCKDVNIKCGNGVIDLTTGDKDINVDAQLGTGTCSVNNIRNINKGISTSYGKGQDNVRIKLDSGVVNVKSQE